ncbi:MAG: putative transposase [Burkholderia sp.]|nr:putative transposase [Burkholderia sp.]
MPQAWDKRRHLLQLESQIWWYDCAGCAAVEGAGNRERATQALAGRIHAGQCGVEGHRRPKVVGPQAKRAAVSHLMATHKMGVTRACGLIGISSPIPVRSQTTSGYGVEDSAVRTGGAKASLWLSSSACAVALGRLGNQQQAYLPGLPRSRPDGAQTETKAHCRGGAPSESTGIGTQ